MARRSGKLWSLEELRVLAAIYFNASFSIGDDARDECRAIADSLGRTPSSVDRQWRNLHAVVQGKSAVYNVGKLVREAAAEYLADPRRTKALALDICTSEDWPLSDLIEEGEHDPLDSVGVTDEFPRLVPTLVSLCSRIQFKAYPKSQGFEVEELIKLTRGREAKAKLQAIYVPSASESDPGPSARTADVGAAIAAVIPELDATIFRTGRVGMLANTTVSVAGETFKVKIDVSQL